MKKIVLLLMVLILCSNMSGCKPSNMSNVTYESAKTALKIADNYLDFETEANEASDQLDRLYNTIEDQKNEIRNNDNVDEKKRTETLITCNDILIQINSIKLYMLKKDDTKVLESRNKLAECLNAAERKK